MSTVIKTVFNLIILFFTGLAIYFKLPDATAHGQYVSKYGNWQSSAVGPGALIFFALLFTGIRIGMMDRFNKDK